MCVSVIVGVWLPHVIGHPIVSRGWALASAPVKRDWETEELIAQWMLVEDDWRLLGTKTGATRLGFALVLKYFEIEGEFPRYGEQVPPAAVEFVAELVKVVPAEFAKYSFDSRTAKRHRTQVREALGFRPATEEDEARWTTGWRPSSARWNRIGAGWGWRCGGGAAARGSNRRWKRRSSG